MEGSTKEFARSKQNRNRMHGHAKPGRGKGARPGAAPQVPESNAHRYASSEDEALDGPQPRSEGLDLSVLLELAQQHVSTTRVRHYELMATLTDPPPLVGAEAFKVRCVDMRASLILPLLNPFAPRTLTWTWPCWRPAWSACRSQRCLE